MNKSIFAVLLTAPLLLLSGCDQIENSGKQLISTATDSAKQAIDDTHKAATQAIDDARQDLSMGKPEAEPKDRDGKQDI
jgi:vacuolar-type H+-ATPase subunit H